MYKLIYIPLSFVLFIFLNISLDLWLVSFFCITFIIDLYILKMDTFGLSKGSSSSGPQGGEGSSGSGQNPNNKGFKRPFEVSDSDSDRERKAKILRPITTQAALPEAAIPEPALPEDTPLHAKISVASPADKHETINSIYDGLKLKYPNMNTEQKRQFVEDFEQAIEKWNKNHNALTLKDAAMMKVGFVKYNGFLCDRSRYLLKNMAIDLPFDHQNGYQAEFIKSRYLSETTRKEASDIAYFFRFNLIIYDEIKKN